jgi:hypothetical protein
MAKRYVLTSEDSSGPSGGPGTGSEEAIFSSGCEADQDAGPLNPRPADAGCANR